MLQEAGLGGRTANSRKKSLQNKFKWWNQKRLHYYASAGWKIGKIVSRLERNPSNVDHPCQGQWILEKMWMTKENWWHLTLKMIFSVSLLLALPVGASKEPEKDFDNLSLWWSWDRDFRGRCATKVSWIFWKVQILIFTSRLTTLFGQVRTVNIKPKGIFFWIRFSLAVLEDWNLSGWESIKLLPQVFTVLAEEVTQYSIIILYIFVQTCIFLVGGNLLQGPICAF